MLFKIIVAGSRDFDDFFYLEKILDMLLSNKKKEEIEIVHGDAPGADRLGKLYGEERGFRVKAFPAKWRVNGVYDNSAGYKRNVEMGDYADACVVFRVNHSKGSTHMINIATEKKLMLRVYEIKKNV